MCVGGGACVGGCGGAYLGGSRTSGKVCCVMFLSHCEKPRNEWPDENLLIASQK